MDAFMIILRLIHIFAGIFWVGNAFFMLFFLTPTVQALGSDGGKFMQGVLRLTPLVMFMPIVALFTVGSGLIMYWKVSDGFDSDWMSLTSSIVLSIGVVTGILAFGHGGATVGTRSARMKKIAEDIAAAGGPPTPEQMAEIQKLQPELALHTRIAFALMVITVAAMASARYFGS